MPLAHTDVPPTTCLRRKTAGELQLILDHIIARGFKDRLVAIFTVKETSPSPCECIG